MKAHNQERLRTRTFVWTNYERPGGCDCGRPDCNNGQRDGWLPVGAPSTFYPGEGFLVAHDTVEHMNNGSTWRHEMLAFGATLYTRMHHSKRMMEMNVSDLINFLKEDQDWKVPPTKPAWHKPLNGVYEDLLQKFIDSIDSYMEYKNSPLAAILFNVEPIQPPANFSYIKQEIAAWLRHGFRVMERVSGGADKKEMCGMMMAMCDEIDESTQNEPPKFGDKLTVTLNRHTNEFKIKREEV